MKRTGGARRTGIDVLDEIRRVLDIEIEGLAAVRSHVDASFERAVMLLASCSGLVHVTGMGKSGIIASKIAATMRSTGTGASFLHPSEALHGDLGIVREGDAVLAIGKTGETGELNELLRILKKKGVPIISLTSNSNSSMAQLSDVVLDLKVEREACPLNLAPTASTTAALAVGDAIAVTLMKLQNLSEEDFAMRHPGGQLGRRLLLTVADVMHKSDVPPVISVQRSVREMLAEITRFRVGAIAVIDELGQLSGLVTDYDIRKVLESERDIFALSIAAIMNPHPAVIAHDEKAVRALELMRSRHKPIAVLPVVDGDAKVLGILHLHDLISAGI